MGIDPIVITKDNLSKLILWCESTVSTDQHFEGDVQDSFASYKALAFDFLENVKPNILVNKLTTPVPTFNGLTSLECIVDKGLDVYLKRLKPTAKLLNAKAHFTLLQLAASRGNLHTTEALLALGANPLGKTADGKSIVFNALVLPIVHDEKMKQNKQAIYVLLSQYCKTVLDERNESGDSILHIMSIYGYSKLVQDLLTQTTRLAFVPNNFMHYPVHSAILNGRHECAKLLLAVDCVNNLTDSKGRNALHYAARYGNKEMVKICLFSIPKDSVDIQKQTPLILATIAHNTAALEQLIDSGASINMRDNKDRSALHYAVESNNLEAVKCLLAAPDIDVHNIDYESQTPLDLMTQKNSQSEEIRELLLAKAAILGRNISKA